MPKTVAVVGAGMAGLLSAKTLKAAGLVPTVFEASAHIGGIWSPESNYLSQSLKVHVSKYLCTASDFPWDLNPSKPQAPMYPSAAQMGQYLQNYAKHFLNEPNCIRLNTKVTKVDFNSNRRQWRVNYLDSNHPGEDYFDFLVIASGTLQKPFIPPVPGLSRCPKVYDYSQAEILLSQGKLDLSGKTVIVVGGGMSGVDMSGSLYRHNSARVIHVIKRPLCILPRLVPEDPLCKSSPFLPMDLVLLTKIPVAMPDASTVPLTPADLNRAVNTEMRKFLGNQALLAPSLELKDDDEVYLSVSDTYAELARNGDIEVILGEILKIDEANINIASGNPRDNGSTRQISIPHANTVIIFATGFSMQLPFFSKEVLDSINFDRDSFQPLPLGSSILHPKLPQAAFVVLFRHAFFPLMELQACYAASLFSGALPWPSIETQLKDLSESENIRNRFPRKQLPYASYVEAAKSLVQLGKNYEYPNLEYAIAPNHSAAPEATIILEALSSDLKTMREGRYIAAAVYRNLAGKWQFEKYTSASTVTDTNTKFVDARFKWQIHENKFNNTQSYVYLEDNQDHGEYYEYDAISERLYVMKQNIREAMAFVQDPGNGWIGSVRIVGKNGTEWKFSFFFPFNGIYIPTFSKELIITYSDGSIEEIKGKFERQIINGTN